MSYIIFLYDTWGQWFIRIWHIKPYFSNYYTKAYKTDCKLDSPDTHLYKKHWDRQMPDSISEVPRLTVVQKSSTRGAIECSTSACRNSCSETDHAPSAMHHARSAFKL